MTTDMTERLQEIFRAVLERPAGSDVSQLRQPSAEGWDSLAHVTLVAAIESEFGITFDTADALRMTSYEAAERLLEEKGL